MKIWKNHLWHLNHWHVELRINNNLTYNSTKNTAWKDGHLFKREMIKFYSKLYITDNPDKH